MLCCNIKKRRLIIFPAVCILGALLFTGCYAEPTKADLTRVKNQFLNRRFSAPLNPPTQGMSDLELFEMSCAANRVRCDVLLKLMEKEEPDFYKKLMQGNPK